MASHNELGRKGEGLAVEYLRHIGHEILHTNWVSGKAEIDIISKIGNTVCIIEVKTRASSVFGLPQEFVTQKKIRLLIQAVNRFVESIDQDTEVRFDIIAIVKTGNSFNVEYLQNAFFYF